MNWTEEERSAYSEAARKILAEMTLSEKVSLMSGQTARNKIHGALKGTTGKHYNEEPYLAGGNREKGVPPVAFCDGPDGVVCGRGKSTCFPVPMMRAASFDPELEEAIGEAVAEEVLSYGGNLFGGVCINLPYHPGWGRSQETYGEDDFLLGEMGSAMVRGVQKDGVTACVKHFAFNQMENLRFDVDVDTDRRTEREIFLRHFEKCVRLAGAGCVMSAYNRYRGVMCGHNSYLLNDVLKGEWGFEGFVMSDFTWGVRDTVAAANGGQNMEMADTRYFGQRLVEAVHAGKVKPEVIDDAAFRIVRTQLYFRDLRERKLVEFERSGKVALRDGRLKTRLAGGKEHHALALRSAEEGMTLLKNNNDVLPLSKQLQRIAVFGRLADAPDMGDHGSARVYPEYCITPLQGIMEAVSPRTDVVWYEGQNRAHARRLLKESDAAIFIVGLDEQDEGEAISKDENTAEKGAFAGGDRTEKLRIHPEDEAFLNEMAGINRRSIVVLVGGSTLIPGSWLKDVQGLLLYYYAGMEGGRALGKVLFGDSEPGGRLPFVIPADELDLPPLDFGRAAQFYDYWHGYRRLMHLGRKPLFPFGFGLSYTQFELGACEARYDSEAQELNVQACVRNIGSRNGGTVLQVYLKGPYEDDVPTLKGFRRVAVPVKKTAQVRIRVSAFDLARYDAESGEMRVMPGDYMAEIGFSSLDPEAVEVPFTIPGG